MFFLYKLRKLSRPEFKKEGVCRGGGGWLMSFYVHSFASDLLLQLENCNGELFVHALLGQH